MTTTAATAALTPEPAGSGAGGDCRRHHRNHHLGRLPHLGTPARHHRHLLPPHPAHRPHRGHRPHHGRDRPRLRHRPLSPGECCTWRAATAARPSARPARRSTSATPASSSAPVWRRQRHPRDHHRPSVRVRHPHRPLFGPVHSRRMRGKTVLPCRPRRDAKARRCPHGHDISCPTRHVEDDPRLGQPHVRRLLRLRRRGAVQRLRRGPVAPVHHLPAPPARPARLASALKDTRARRCASGTSRSPNTRHAASSTSTPSSAWTPPATTTSHPRPGYTAALLCDAIGQAAAAVSARRRPGQRAVRLGFGPQTDARPIRHGSDLPGTGQALSGQAVANYIAKYATKP